MIDVVVVCLLVHVTVALLSEKMPTWACLRVDGAMRSRISHASSTPAISRSLMDIDPLGFDAETRFD